MKFKKRFMALLLGGCLTGCNNEDNITKFKEALACNNYSECSAIYTRNLNKTEVIEHLDNYLIPVCEEALNDYRKSEINEDNQILEVLSTGIGNHVKNNALEELLMQYLNLKSTKQVCTSAKEAVALGDYKTAVIILSDVEQVYLESIDEETLKNEVLEGLAGQLEDEVYNYVQTGGFSEAKALLEEYTSYFNESNNFERDRVMYSKSFRRL